MIYSMTAFAHLEIKKSGAMQCGKSAPSINAF